MPPRLHLTPAARRFAPALAATLQASGIAADAPAKDPGAARVAMADEPAETAAPTALRLAPADGAPPHIRAGAGAGAGAAPCLVFDPPSDPFGLALAAELLRDRHRPAAADAASRALLELAERVAQSPVTALITGPTGVGKEGLARFLHAASPRAGGPMVAINCAALPEAMLEAILFGHERGAFTGAASASLGLFRAAERGTLLLDEVGETPLPLQAKLLRALQEREVLPLGATTPVAVDVRVIAASNRDLAAEVAAGRLREDLYWRLAVFPLTIAPLARRPADIPAITAALLLRHGGPAARWWPTPAALAALTGYGWPGNVRELENALQRALVLAGGGRIAPAQLRLAPTPPIPLAAAGAVPARTLPQIVRGEEHAAIRATLAACGGRRIEAARRLGISERTLRYKLADMARTAAPGFASGRPA